MNKTLLCADFSASAPSGTPIPGAIIQDAIARFSTNLELEAIYCYPAQKNWVFSVLFWSIVMPPESLVDTIVQGSSLELSRLHFDAAHLLTNYQMRPYRLDLTIDSPATEESAECSLPSSSD